VRRGRKGVFRGVKSRFGAFVKPRRKSEIMKTCLILDENKKLKIQLSKYLNKQQYHVSQAEDCRSGLEFCNKHMPDVILIGSNTPRENLHCLLSGLENNVVNDAPVVIYCTEGQNQKKVDEALMDGATDYLVMPFDNDLFTFKLRQSGLLS